MRSMMIFGAALVVLAMAVGPASAESVYKIDYADYDATITDSKGVTTRVTDFGFNTGPNIISAKRGDAHVDIPFRRVRLIEIGKFIAVGSYNPAEVTTNKGKKHKVEIPRFEGSRFLYGKTDLGTIRIRLDRLRRIEIHRLSHTEGRGGGLQ